MSPVEVPIEKWTGKIAEVTLGGQGGRKGVTVGGANTLPFLKFEGTIPHKPVVAIEIQDRKPNDWSPHLISVWGNVMDDPGKWAKKAVEYGANIVTLRLRSAHPEAGNTGASEAKKSVNNVLSAVDVPLIVLGPNVAEKDTAVLGTASEVGKGQRLGIGNCEGK